MDQQAFKEVNQNSPEAIPTQMRQIEGREWWLWGFAIAVTLALTLGIVSFTFPWFRWDKRRIVLVRPEGVGTRAGGSGFTL